MTQYNVRGYMNDAAGEEFVSALILTRYQGDDGEWLHTIVEFEAVDQKVGGAARAALYEKAASTVELNAFLEEPNG